MQPSAIAPLVAELDMMEAFGVNILHFRCNRVATIASEAVDARAHKEMRAELLGQTIELVDITFPIADMHATVRPPQETYAPAQGLKPADAPPSFRFFDLHACRIDLLL
jgi:hypothetical protein